MTDGIAKVPDWHDMDWGQFAAHWHKRHGYLGYFPPEVMDKYPDDDCPLWWSVKGAHDKIHAGTLEIRKSDGGIHLPPTDHIHLPRVDPAIQRALEELL